MTRLPSNPRASPATYDVATYLAFARSPNTARPWLTLDWWQVDVSY